MTLESSKCPKPVLLQVSPFSEAYRAGPFRACGSNWWGGHMPFPAAVGQKDRHRRKRDGVIGLLS